MLTVTLTFPDKLAVFGHVLFTLSTSITRNTANDEMHLMLNK